MQGVHEKATSLRFFPGYRAQEYFSNLRPSVTRRREQCTSAVFRVLATTPLPFFIPVLLLPHQPKEKTPDFRSVSQNSREFYGPSRYNFKSKFLNFLGHCIAGLNMSKVIPFFFLLLFSLSYFSTNPNQASVEGAQKARWVENQSHSRWPHSLEQRSGAGHRRSNAQIGRTAQKKLSPWFRSI